MRHIHNIVLLLATVAAMLLSSCGKDFKDDIDSLNTRHAGIETRVSNLEALMAQMNTKLSKVSALADAVEKGLYITQVKTTADGYELTLSNGKIIILQNTSDNWLVPTPAVSMTQISGLYYWTLNGLLFTDSDGKPVRSSGKAP
ncbi:MAG: hypothetical protein IJQ59_06405, partial [Bacteroidaceae bacterium]|nr:hypothetical protein [Prevotella sp.]MBR0273705.1 hypothetical protein [Bacteroidaceae bacterium]